MPKIERLTPEQEKLVTTVREEWLERVFSLRTLDTAEVERGVRWMYSVAGLAEPQLLVVKSPMAVQIAANILHSRARVWAQVWAQVTDQVRDQVGAQVWGQVKDQVWDQVGDQVLAQVRDQVRAQVTDQVRAQVWDQVGDQVLAQVRDQVRAQVTDQVRAQVTDQVRAQVTDQVWDQVGVRKMKFFGPLWWTLVGYSEWGAWSDFYARIGVAADHEGAVSLRAFLRANVWYFVPLDGVAIVCGAPLVLRRDADGRMHCADGPAAVWEDGWAMYMWHGVRVPGKLILHPEDYSRDDYLREENAEVRRVAKDILGSRFAQLLDLVEIDRQRVGTGMQAKEAVLLRTAEPDEIAERHIQFVNVVCHSTEREYMLCVPETINDAWQAVAWTFGMTKEEYDPLVEA